MDVRIEMEGNWHAPKNQWVIGKWAPGQQSWAIYVYQGQVYFRRTTDGTDLSTGSAYAVTLPQLPARAALRMTYDADNGASGNTVTFYWAPSMDSPTWTMIDRPVIMAGTSSVFAGTAPLQIGISDYRATSSAWLQRLPMDGRVYRAEVRSGIGGTVVAAPDFRGLADGTTSFTDSTSKVWSLAGRAEIRNREDRFVGEVSSWPLKWSTDDTDAWTSVTASGALRRMGQGVKALDSALRRRIPSGNPIAYWPLEESQDATRAYSPIKGVFPASVSSVEWASVDTLPSSAPLPRLTGTSSLSAPVPAATPGEWQVEFVYNADDNVPVADAQVISFSSSDGAIKRWTIEMRLGQAIVSGFTSASATVASRVIWQGVTIGADVFHGWTRLRFWAVNDLDGSGFTWRIAWQDAGGDAGGLTKTYATGTCGSLSLISADWPAETEGWSVGHITVLPESNSTLFNGSDIAYLGETAWERMRRLSQEEGFSLSRTPGRLDVQPVGYQRRDSLLSLLEAAADAEGGFLTEDIRRIGLHYRDRSSLYMQDPALTLSYTAPGLGPDLEPVDDDSDVVNDVTVARDSGSSARAVQEDGPLSVLPAPDGIGKYDASHTLSLAYDEQTEPIAYWRLHLGTHDGARYPTVSLMLHKPGAEALIPAVLALREGDKIRLTDLPGWVSHDDVDLIVLGWSETLDLYRWDMELNCVPAAPWDTAIVNTIVEDFEDNVYAVDLSFAGSLPWARSSTRYQFGTSSLQSGAITNNQDSDAIVTLPPGAASVSFWYRTSSEPSGSGFTGDYLSVLRDGVEVLRAQGETPWTLTTLDVSATSRLTFRYHKDNSSSAGENAVWIDHLRVSIGRAPGIRAETAGSDLAAAATATATSLTVRTPVGLLWTQDPADMPFLIGIGGEVMRVTAVAPATSTTQTFTVVRSVNGVVKPQASGTVVRLASPSTVSL
jgi:hypothetical protein